MGVLVKTFLFSVIVLVEPTHLNCNFCVGFCVFFFFIFRLYCKYLTIGYIYPRKNTTYAQLLKFYVSDPLQTWQTLVVAHHKDILMKSII